MRVDRAVRAGLPAASEPLGAWRTWTTAALVAAAAVLLVTLVTAAGSHRLGFDFRAAYLPAAEAVREGTSPYTTTQEREADAEWHPYHYPPQLAVALVPATFLSTDVASLLAFLASFVSVMGALALVGVRDLRCYAAAVLWAPTWHALEMANISAALALGLALVWRYRERTVLGGIALGVTASVKVFLAPMLVWTLATRRIRATGVALASGALLTFGTWAAIGFVGLASYPEQRTMLGQEGTYSSVALAAKLGYSETAGMGVAVALGGSLLLLCVWLARRRDDLRAFTSVLAAALVLSPSLWQHYLVLLVVPVALARPRFSPLWLAPIALWMSPRAGNGDGGLESFLPLAVSSLVVSVILVQPRCRSLVTAPT